MHFKRKGFTLVELALAIAIFGAGQAYRTHMEHQERQNHIARTAGESLASQMSAIDRRFALDGLRGTEDYAGRWFGAEVRDMLQEELIAYDNHECGVDDGWRPRQSNMSTLALISCGELQVDAPFNLNVASERTTANDAYFVKDWSISLYPDYAQSNYDVLRLLELIRSAQLNTVHLRSGIINYELYNVTTDDVVEIPVDCLSEAVSCGVRGVYSPSLLFGEDSTAIYFRTDGTLPMQAGISFNSNTLPVKCEDADGFTVECGFELGDGRVQNSDDVVLNVHTMSAPSIYFESGYGDCGVNGKDCGVFYENGTVRQAYDYVFGRELIIGEDGRNIFSFGSNQDNEVEAYLNANLYAFGDTRVGDGMESDTFNAKDELRLYGDIFTDVSDIDIYQAEHMNLSSGVSTVGAPCIPGEIQTTSSNQILTCSGGYFSLYEKMPSGMVAAFQVSNQRCPDGWSSVSQLNSNQQIAPSHGTPTGSVVRGGASSTMKMTTDMMPRHSHKYQQFRWTSNSIRSGSGGNSMYTGVDRLTTDPAGRATSAQSSFNIFPSAWSLRYCVKD